MGAVPVDDEPSLWRSSLPTIGPSTHKYTRGLAVVVGGHPVTGAARLAARACARSGAGATVIACAPSALESYLASVESIMVRAVDGPDALAALLADPRTSAVLIGPGAGVGAATRGLVSAALESGRPAVLDADALTSFEDDPTELFAMLHARCVLTPHAGEFARVFPAESLVGDHVERAAAAAARSGSVVLLKGRDTAVAAPDGRVVVNRAAPPTLATAGSGDVLAGIILGLCAQGMAPFGAACAAAWVHAEAARRAPAGLIADDLPELAAAVLGDVRGW
ncbi:MAG: NAD(P)H-hydrate dehydratase [Acidobacteria bacterium]|nr:NAD(P)H-hydrate dehydratase [Acidobacteriota bacterium]